MKNSMEFPQKIENRTTIWSNNPAYKFISKKIKSQAQIDICTHMFTAALFTIAKTQRQPKCLPIGEWMKKCDTHTL